MKRRKRPNHRVCQVLSSVAASALLAGGARAAFDQKNTKIIEWGWDTNASAPSGTPFVQGSIPANRTTFEQLPFDGVGIDLQKNPPLSNGTGDYYGRNSFGNTTLNTSTYSNTINALTSTPFQRFSNNAQMLFVTPGNVDWFDNTGFGKINNNAQTAASVAHSTPGTTTVFLDIEPYGSNVWYYDGFTSAQKSAHTYAQYQGQVRVRGQQYMNALRAAYPDVQVMLTFGYERPSGPSAENGLLSSFVDGLLDAAGPNNTVYDGYEYSYGFTSLWQCESAYDQMRVDHRNITGNQTAFDAHYRASYAMWLDYGPWYSDPASNYYTPDKFQFAMQQMAMRSDGFVWVYSQKPSWYYPTVAWSNGNAVQQAYKDALANVRRKGQLERFTGIVKDTATWAEHAEGGASISQNNTLSIAAMTGEADYTTNSVIAQPKDLVSAEVTRTGTSGAALMGFALTNDSGGAGNSVLADTRKLFIEWSDASNGIYAGVSDANGSNQLTLIAAGDQGQNYTYVYQIERLSGTSAKFTVWNNVGDLVGTPVTLTGLSGLPDTLKPAMFVQSGSALFDNVWIGNPYLYPTWNVNADGAWSSASNWYAGVPNAVDAEAHLYSVIGSTRTLTIASPTTVGTLRFNNANSYVLSGAGSLSMQVSYATAVIDVQAGSHQINVPLTLVNDTNVSVANGSTLTVSNLTMTAASLTKTGAGTLSVDRLRGVGATISGGKVIVRSSGASNAGASKLTFLAVSPSAKLDITDNSIVINWSGSNPLTAIRQAIIDGRGVVGFNVGNWNGTQGIISTSAGGDAFNYGIGYAQNNLQFFGGVTSLDGQTANSNAILVKFTRGADANLDGIVDDTDVSILGAFYDPTATGQDWNHGDFTYDGKVDDDDVSYLGALYNPTAPPLSQTMLASLYGQSFAAAFAAGQTQVPEPAGFALLGAAGIAMLRRRIRRH